MSVHSCVLNLHLKERLSAGAGGKYGRMFGTLAGLEAREDELVALGRAGAAIDVGSDDPAGDNPAIPAGFTMLGHFVAHDLTADRSLLHHHAQLKEIRNFRSGRLDLDSLYGAGQGGAPHLYDVDDGDKFLLGVNDRGEMNDVPRNRQQRALLGDPRNDVHMIMAQFHLALLKFHNAAVDRARADGAAPDAVFEEAQRNVRWHVQWVVLHQYLPLVCGPAIAREVLDHGPKYFKAGSQAVIPVEFADAAYRFGHAQIRMRYQLNDETTETILPGLMGGRAIPATHVVDWRRFFALDPAVTPQASRRIAPQMAHALVSMPEHMLSATSVADADSLACRDLLRAHALRLPSGESIARHIGVKPLTPAEADLQRHGWSSETPLWYYILREAAVRENGERLGPVGARIVADVLVGLNDADPLSYRSGMPGWTPAFASGTGMDFTIEDLLRFAGVAEPGATSAALPRDTRRASSAVN